MVGLKEFCALLLAGSMGAGGVVAVQEVKPRVTKARAAPKAKPAAARPPVRAAAARPMQGEGSSLEDCPIYAPLPGSVLANLGMAPNQQADVIGSFLPGGPAPGGGFVRPNPPGGGGSGGGGGIDPFPPGGGGGGGAVVPEPAAWAMMVSGFGLIGLALRSSNGTGSTGESPAAL